MKKPPKKVDKKKSEIQELSAFVRGLAVSARKTSSSLQDLSEFVRDHVVTKKYLEEVLEKKFDKKLTPIYDILQNHTVSLAEIREEVRDIRRCIQELDKKVAHLKEYRKDIDFLYHRLETIEKHIEMKKL